VAPRPSFRPELLRFLAGLKAHNAKPWFEAHRAEYERFYREAFAQFVTDFGERLATISPYLVADPRPTGGSVMRIYRDTRFTPDKSPYRSYTVVHFGHRDAGKGSAPGLFLYVAPDEISGGGGWWHADPPQLAKVRAAIVRDPAGWTHAVGAAAFRRRFELTGESLKRPPPGIAADHPLLTDLRRKDFVASTQFSRLEFTSPGFLSRYEDAARTVSPLLRFLCRAVDLPY
jgi:uncharacterized protein (TIGR02453 family)